MGNESINDGRVGIDDEGRPIDLIFVPVGCDKCVVVIEKEAKSREFVFVGISLIFAISEIELPQSHSGYPFTIIYYLILL